MRRAILKLGDKTTAGGTVLEGIDCCLHHGTPITFIGAQIWCPQCNSTGRIGWQGPHQIARMMGKQQALENDICLCKCDPPPVCLASQHDSFHVFTAEEVANYGNSRTASAAAEYGASVLQGGVAGRFGGHEDEADDHADEDESPYPAPVASKTPPADCSYLDGTKDRIDAPADFYRHTNTVRVSPGKQTTHDFPGGGVSPATEYAATINGHPVSIFTPLNAPPQGSGLADEETLAKALEVVPPQQYEHLNSLAANSSPYSKDSYWQEKYNVPSFSSAATADIVQGINFYPWKGWTKIPQQYIDSTMLHESGHIWTDAHWNDNPALKQNWLDAMASDGQAPSKYALKNENEDFAESANMYWSSLGTPCEVEGRKRYPARYSYFDSNVR